MQTPEKIKSIFHAINEEYDHLNIFFSLGLALYWRKMLVQMIDPHSGELILDCCSGTADIAISIAKRQPGAKITALDFSDTMLKVAAKKISQNGLSASIAVKTGDAICSGLNDQSFDKIAIGFGIRNMHDWRAGIKEAWRIIRQGGSLSILEFSLPTKTMLPLYEFYILKIIPLIARIFSDEQAYIYLGRSIIKFAREADIPSAMHEAGFRDINVKRLTFGIVSIYHGIK